MIKHIQKKIGEKVQKLSERLHELPMRRKKILFTAIGAVLCFLVVSGILLFSLGLGSENKKLALEEETKERKPFHVMGFGDYTLDPPVLETGTQSTEAETVEETVAPPTKAEKKKALIDVKELEIAQEDLSEPEEKKEDIPVVSGEDDVTISEIPGLVYGIDVSRWQGSNINWAKVKADGIQFAMIKLGGRSTGGDGRLYEDICFEKNIQGALANGIQVGVYFFSQAVTEQEALEEASMVVSYIQKYKITYPVAFDWESAAGYRVNNYGLTREKLTSIASTFCDAVAGAGYTPMVYFNRTDWYNAVNAPQLTSKYKSWLAIYLGKYYNNPNERNWYDASSQELPVFKYSYQMWQYTSRGHVNGINGHVDLNIAFFTYGNYHVDKSPVTLEVSNKTVTTNAGTNIDLMQGVSAHNSIGFDATSDVTVNILDENGNSLGNNSEAACNSPGKYTVEYNFKDPTGEMKKSVSQLIVRGVPVISLKQNRVDFTYDFNLTEEENNKKLNDILTLNVSAVSFEGEKLDVMHSDLPPVSEEGTYTVEYTTDDGKGMVSRESATLVIVIPKEESTAQSETFMENY